MKNQYPGLARQVAFITGAASGIGTVQVRAFLEQDAFVFGLDQKFGKMEEISLRFPETFAYALGGVRRMRELQQAVSECQNHFGEVTTLLNTAGILDAYKPLMETDESPWDLIYETNVKSMYQLTKTILPGMVRQKSGTIINMASIAGLAVGGGGIAHTSAKRTTIGFTKQLALGYVGQGIRVKGVAPGVIQTPVNMADFERKGEMTEWVANETLARRRVQPEEVTELTLFLASSQASYIQGTIIPIDGGWLLR